jgi:hypothetical protein
MHHIAVEFVAPFRIYLPDRFFTVTTGDGAAEVKAIPLPPQRHDGGVGVHGARVEIPHDLFGYAGRTKFCLILDEEVDISSHNWKSEIANRDHAIRDLGIRYANRVLEVYRDRDRDGLGEESFHVVPLVRADLSRIRICVVDEHLNEYPDFVITWPTFSAVGTGGAVDRDAAVIADIDAMLKSGDAIPVQRELVSSAQNHLWRSVYRLVPVEANTAFESFIPEMITKIDPAANITPLQDLYSKLFKLQDVLSTALSAAGLGTVSWFSAPSGGWKTLTDQKLAAWHSDCYLLRNRVIHEGYSAVTQSEAQASLDAMLVARQYIEDEAKRIP